MPNYIIDIHHFEGMGAQSVCAHIPSAGLTEWGATEEEALERLGESLQTRMNAIVHGDDRDRPIPSHLDVIGIQLDLDINIALFGNPDAASRRHKDDPEEKPSPSIKRGKKKRIPGEQVKNPKANKVKSKTEATQAEITKAAKEWRRRNKNVKQIVKKEDSAPVRPKPQAKAPLTEEEKAQRRKAMREANELRDRERRMNSGTPLIMPSAPVEDGGNGNKPKGSKKKN